MAKKTKMNSLGALISLGMGVDSAKSLLADLRVRQEDPAVCFSSGWLQSATLDLGGYSQTWVGRKGQDRKVLACADENQVLGQPEGYLTFSF